MNPISYSNFLRILFFVCICGSLRAQSVDERVDSIRSYVEAINKDSSLPCYLPNKGKPKILRYYVNHLQVYKQNDKPVIVREAILHLPYKQFDYYFKDEKLVMVRVQQDYFCRNKLYYFHNKKLLKTESEKCSTPENDKSMAKYFIKKSKDFLKMKIGDE